MELKDARGKVREEKRCPKSQADVLNMMDAVGFIVDVWQREEESRETTVERFAWELEEEEDDDDDDDEGGWESSEEGDESDEAESSSKRIKI